MPQLQRLFTECIKLNRVPESWLAARVVIIPKYSLYPQDYRPISLLNLDYNILMTILAHKLNGILGCYIHRDQAVFLKHQHMQEKTRLLTNIIEWVKNSGDPTLLFSLNADKVFDRLE